MSVVAILLLSGALLALAGFSYWKINQYKLAIDKQEIEYNHRVYELSVLRQLSERIGYTFDVKKISDVIIGSLSKFIEFKTVSYMIVEPDGVLLNIHLEDSVSQKFINTLRKNMLLSLSALLNTEFSQDKISETFSGTIIDEESMDPLESFFNIPLVIGDNVVGVITVAHTAKDMYKSE
ncbi:MAG: hypothetical protein Q8P90_02915, partial [bacterium]|nr:hypothetical protein [bacterium]